MTVDAYRFRVCSCLHAVSLANPFLVSMIYGVYTIAVHRNIRDDCLLVSVDIGTYMQLDLLLGSAKGCLGSTCISLCGWKGVLTPGGGRGRGRTLALRFVRLERCNTFYLRVT